MTFAIMMAAMTAGLYACTEKTESTTDMDGNGATGNENFQIQMTRAVPSQYFTEAAEQGQVVRIEYESKDYTRDDRPVIVVSPTWDKDNRAKDWGESCGEIAVFHNEYENDLVPAVESRFSTYAETTDRAGIHPHHPHQRRDERPGFRRMGTADFPGG